MNMILYITLLLCTWCSLSAGHNHPDHDLVKNIAVLMEVPGNVSVYFSCSATAAKEHIGDWLRWKFWRPGETGAGIIVKETEVFDVYSNPVTFGLSLKDFPLGTMSYGRTGYLHQVFISNVQTAHAGIFDCYMENADIHSRGNLVVLHDFTCEIAHFGDVARLECEVSGTGYKAPKLRWREARNVIFDETDEFEGQVNHTSGFKVKTTAEVNIGLTNDLHGTGFTCELSFEEEPRGMKPAPELKRSCTRVMDDLKRPQNHPPTNLRIIGEAARTGVAIGGDQITCKADGYPKPDIYWDVHGQAVMNPVYTFPYVTNTIRETISCFAVNYIDGEQQMKRRDLTVTVASTPMPQEPVAPVVGIRRAPSGFTIPPLLPRPGTTTLHGMNVPDDPPAEESGNNAGIMGGIAGGILLLCVLVIIVSAYFGRRRYVDGEQQTGSLLHLSRSRTTSENPA
jgi:hypothetical protein